VRCELTSEAFQTFVRELESEKKIDREDLRYFLSRIIDTGNRLHKAGIRSVVVIAGLAGLFVLMSAGGLTEAELFGVKVSRFSLFLLVIPVAIALVFARAVVLIKSSVVYKHVAFDITARYYPSWSRSGLDGLLLSSDYWLSGAVHENFFERGAGRRVLLFSSTVELIVWSLAPVAFDIYAYFVLFRSHEIQPIGVVISSIIAGALIIVGWINFMTMPVRLEPRA
jgi:hypothetical protein